jgi:RNA polymerase sigma-70 factor, ECF subfamily
MEWTDAAAVAQVLAGDRDAFGQLVERHSRTIFRLGFRMTGNEDDANEVVQEAFMRAYKRLDRFESRSSFGTWIYRIAVNCALDLLGRRQQHETNRVVEDPEHEDGQELQIPSTDPSPERLVLSAEMQAKVQEALKALSPAERMAFLLRHFENKSIEEIAQVLNIKEGAAKHSIFRAVQKMRKGLEPALRSVR